VLKNNVVSVVIIAQSVEVRLGRYPVFLMIFSPYLIIKLNHSRKQL